MRLSTKWEIFGLLPSGFHHNARDQGAPCPMENLVVPGRGCVRACSIEYGTRPPPAQVSHPDQPVSCSILEMVIAFAFAACAEADADATAPAGDDDDEGVVD